jgi:diphthine methyl ester acylhydrolase
MINRLTTTKVDLCPDALEYLHGSRILTSACYQLDTATSIKTGSLNLYRIPESTTTTTSTERTTASLSDIQQQSTYITTESLPLLSLNNDSAIFDIRWRPNENDRSSDKQKECAVVTAGGSASVYRLKDELEDSPYLERIDLVELDPSHNPSSLSALYINWLDYNSMSIGKSDGSVSILSFREEALSIVSTWSAHQLGGCPIEVWVTESHPKRPSVLWTGGDDSLLKGWDTRSPSMALFVSKSHSAGVTSIKWNPFVENVVATGSYDECLRIWDERYMSKGPISILPDLGGGVWRIKWHPHVRNQSLLAAACMLGGAHIIDALGTSGSITESIEENKPRKIGSYTEHKSLVYATEWLYSDKESTIDRENVSSQTHILASCSFYEKEIHTWSLERPSS